MTKRAAVLIAIGIAGAGLLSGQYLVHAAESNVRGGSFVVASSTATNNITDLWVLDQNSRTVYLCRSSGNSGSSPICSKGMQLP